MRDVPGAGYPAGAMESKSRVRIAIPLPRENRFGKMLLESPSATTSSVRSAQTALKAIAFRISAQSDSDSLVNLAPIKLAGYFPTRDTARASASLATRETNS
jgi:hypothetical protein